MSFETVRINELAKELGLSSKEVIEKFAQISVTGKTHSSTVTLDQIKKLKEFLYTLEYLLKIKLELLKHGKIKVK